MNPEEKAKKLARMNEAFMGLIPHNGALGLRFVDFGPAAAVVEMPWAPHLVGYPETLTVHGGAVSSLLDTTGGGAVFLRMKAPVPIATLDMRVDYMKPAIARQPIRARCECYKLTSQVAFVRGIAFHEDEDDPIASMAATYMLSTHGEQSVWGRGSR